MGFIVTGIDISRETLEEAENRFGSTPNLQFIKMDAQNISLPENEKFDAVVCSEVLEHLNNPEALVTNFRNLLKPDGTVVVTVPNGWGPRELLVTRPSQILLSGNSILSRALQVVKGALHYTGNNLQTSARHLDHVQFFTLRALQNLAQTSGFRITRRRAGNFIDNTFPFSLFTRKFTALQAVDCAIADILPLCAASAFYTVWRPDR